MLVEVRCPDVAPLGPAELAAAVSEEVLRDAPTSSAVLKSRESEMQQRSTRSVRPNLERTEKAVSQEKTKSLAIVAGRLLCFGSAPAGELTPFTFAEATCLEEAWLEAACPPAALGRTSTGRRRWVEQLR